jgi:carboxymethylenebutenolidase
MWNPDVPSPLVGSVLYYGTTGGAVLTRSTTPVLGHFAADDPYEDAAWVAEFAQTMRGAGREVTIHTYPGTGHWFAEPSRDAYRADAAELAWERTLAFLRQHLA